MGGRTDWLTEVAKPVAEKLAARCGSLKKTLSAGIMALDFLSPSEREYFMAKAEGMITDSMPNPEEILREKILEIVKEAGAIPAKKKPSRGATSSKTG